MRCFSTGFFGVEAKGKLFYVSAANFPICSWSLPVYFLQWETCFIFCVRFIMGNQGMRKQYGTMVASIHG